jgi:rod shape-determining protein MreC
MGARDRAPVRSQVAEVLYDTRDPFARRIVLDKGLQQGIVNGQPVIDSTGVVGQVTRVFPLSSELTLLTDRHIAIPVQVQRNGLRAIASGSGQGGRMELRYLSVNADLKEGDLVVTSGLDSVYPPGLPVGKVLSVDRSGAGNFARILVEPVAKVDNGRVMLVLMTDTSGLPPPPPAELPESQRGKRSGTRRN